MDQVNKTLILSLKQDILSLNKSIEDIPSEAEICSWLFPTKKHMFVKDFIVANKIFEDDNMKLYLELTIDRLYVGLRLILSRLEELLNNGLEKHPFIQRPQQITLGCSFNNLWKLIEIILARMRNKDISEKTSDKSITITKVDKNLQTNISSLNKCDSCASAMMCMKNLLTIFENGKKDNTCFKSKIRPKIFDITQFGCMLQTTTAIESSMSTLFQKFASKEQENQELLSQCEKLRRENSEKYAKVAQLEQEVKLYKEKNERDSTKIALLKSVQEDALDQKSKTDNKIETLNGIILNLKDSIAVHRMTIQKLTNEKEQSKKCFESMWSLQKNIFEKYRLQQRKISIVDKELCYIEEGFKQFQTTIENINKKLNKISKCHIASEAKLKIISENSAEELLLISDKFTQFKENVKQKLLEASINNFDGSQQNKPKFKIKGNPIEDISRQIDENNEKIRQLDSENRRLKSVISKFELIKK
ncbi:hypothetical protein JTB14_003519 [Gonioctena quinquepunctata]|nr:hypothetical protein JTB14_003519 [Gonioctena quinquepunctata]